MSKDKAKCRALSIEKGAAIDSGLIDEYAKVLPKELINMWKEYGYGCFLNGYLRIINPKEYQQLLSETYFCGACSVPILTTAFGDIITVEDDQHIGMVKYKYGDFDIIAKNFGRFIQNMPDECFQQDYFELEKYEEAVQKYGRLDNDKCFGYTPLLALGGNEKVDNLTIVNTKEHIMLITQLVGNIGM